MENLPDLIFKCIQKFYKNHFKIINQKQFENELYILAENFNEKIWDLDDKITKGDFFEEINNFIDEYKNIIDLVYTQKTLEDLEYITKFLFEFLIDVSGYTYDIYSKMYVRY